jgi:hypothetical protein
MMCMVLGQNESQTCELPGCDNPITQLPGAAPPRKYCCSEHRREARRLRYAARAGASPEPPHTERPVVPLAGPSLRSERPSDRQEKKVTRRGTRAILALAGVSAVAVGLIPGDTGFTPGDTGTHQTAAGRPRTTSPEAATAVDATWAPRAKKVLAQVNADLSQIAKAEAAAAAVPREKWSARLRTLMQHLRQRESDLTRLRTLLQSNLSLVANYGRAAENLAGTKKQLGLLNQARESLRSLSGPAREEMAWILNGLADRAGKLSQQERSHQDAEQGLRKPAAEASNQALPDLPADIPSLVRAVNEEADASNPSRPDHGRPRPNGGSPWADRPPSPPHSPPGRSNRTGAPPHPHSPSPSANDEPSTPADHKKAPIHHEPSTPSTPAPSAPAHHDPPPQAPARPATPSGGGGGSQAGLEADSGGGGDSGSVASDATDASDSGGTDAGTDAGSDGGDGSDGGGGDGGDGGGGDGGE